MMNKSIASTLLALLAVFPSISLAGDDTYVCKIDGILETWGDAETADYWMKRHMNEEVLVDRNTGQVRHLGVGNTYYEKIQLLHRGDTGNAFKVISSSNNGWQAHYMVVEENADGVEKRFVIVDGGYVWRGICR
jgi:hypothetical protein